MKSQLYFTSNKASTFGYLKTTINPYHMIDSWGQRLRQAMGAEEILSRNYYIGGEFRVPTYRSMAEALDRVPWITYSKNESTLFVMPYNDLYDGWENGERRHGLMAVSVSPYEYSYGLWDLRTQHYSPDLLDNGTWNVWAELLPEPCLFSMESGRGILRWNADEPRVYRATEMGRYQIPQKDCFVEIKNSEYTWRIMRAEAYVQAWEKMAAMEPEDRYKSICLAEHERLEKKWNRK